MNMTVLSECSKSVLSGPPGIGTAVGSCTFGRWEAGGGKSRDRRRSLEMEWIDRCRPNRFGHGMLYNPL